MRHNIHNCITGFLINSIAFLINFFRKEKEKCFQAQLLHFPASVLFYFSTLFYNAIPACHTAAWDWPCGAILGKEWTQWIMEILESFVICGTCFVLNCPWICAAGYGAVKIWETKQESNGYIDNGIKLWNLNLHILIGI